jgi:AraC family transcriptional regulator of adaptative response/methylated-DNA-[protein]-cysteine methyltransferase
MEEGGARGAVSSGVGVEERRKNRMEWRGGIWWNQGMTTKGAMELARYLQEHAEESHTLGGLSARCGVSPFHLQRRFKSLTGLTPKQFIDGARLRRFKEELRTAGGVLDAIYAAGFGAPSRLYERVDTHLGMTPGEYREGGEGVAMTWVAVETAMGVVGLAATDRGLCFVQFGESAAGVEEALAREFPRAERKAMAEPWPEQMQGWAESLREYLAGRTEAVRLPVDLRGTVFQTMVWNYLMTIPRGETRSYQQVAAAVGRPEAARAVANACARNRIAIVVPCHRVIRGTGEAGGYRWGLERKRALLEMERAATSVR